MTAEIPLVSAASFALRLPEPAALTPGEELALLRNAYGRNPGSVGIRYRLASELVAADHFEEAIALLEQWDLREPQLQLLLAEALRTRETTEANQDCRELCLSALSANREPAMRSQFLALLGKVLITLGELDQARACLREALDLVPQNKDAYKRVANLALSTGDAHAVLVHADSMVAAGVLHSRVIASQALAFAQLGWMDEARRVAGLDRFLVEVFPETPAGFETLGEFCEAAGAEMRTHPGQRFSSYGAASVKTWRVNKPELHRSTLVPELQRLIQREVEAYVARLLEGEAAGHPFVLGLPRRAMLRNWCVIAEGEGYESWHVHQNGWLSGVFYLYVQDHIAQGTGPEGCIAFGLPEEVVGAEAAAAFGEHIVRPRTGMMMLFPSHSYHRTYPHFGPGQRICYAFDVVPELEQQ